MTCGRRPAEKYLLPADMTEQICGKNTHAVECTACHPQEEQLQGDRQSVQVAKATAGIIALQGSQRKKWSISQSESGAMTGCRGRGFASEGASTSSIFHTSHEPRHCAGIAVFRSGNGVVPESTLDKCIGTLKIQGIGVWEFVNR
jgi:hypothetical protein